MALPPVKVKFLGQDEFSNMINRANAKLKKFGRTTTQAGKKLTTSLTLPLTLMGGAAIKMSTDFNSAMANVGTLIPGNLKRLNELKAGVQELAIETGKSTTDLAGGLFQVISAFGDTGETMNKLRSISRGAVAGIAETGETLKLVSMLTKNYGDISDTATKKVLDLAFKTNELGQTSFVEMASAMGPTIPIAKTLGLSMEELFGVMATFTGITGNTSEATTQLRSFLGALIKPTGDMEIAFKRLGVKSGAELIRMKGLQGAMDDLTAITKPYAGVLGKVLGRKEALTLVLGAAGELSEEFTEKLRKMNNVMGSTEKAFKEQTEGINKTGFKMLVLRRRVEVLAQKFGDALAPTLLKVVNGITPVIKWLTNLSGTTKKLIFFVGIIVASLGPFLVALGTLSAVLPFVITGILTLSTALLFLFANPIGLVVVGIAALVTGLVLLIRNWKSVGAWLSGIWSGIIGRVIDDFNAWIDGIKEAWQWVKDLAKALATLDFGTIGDLLVKESPAPGNNVGASPMDVWNTNPWMVTQQARQEATSKIDVNFHHPPPGLRVQAEDGGNLGEITRGFATAGVR